MKRIAVFVDAGYFWVQSVMVAKGAKGTRNDIVIDYEELRIRLLAETEKHFPAADLLRVYWYDGPGPNGKTPSHHAIDKLDDFKLRLGTRNGKGDQKAVDGLIIADMIGLAQTKAITDALLVSGDADLTPGVIAAQGLGIRVHQLSMGSLDATSPYLLAEADRKAHWANQDVMSFSRPAISTCAHDKKSVTQSPEKTGHKQAALPAAAESDSNAEPAKEVQPLPAVQQPAPIKAKPPLAADSTLEAIAKKAVTDQIKEQCATIGETDQLPPDVDRHVPWVAVKELRRKLSTPEKIRLRAIFKAVIK